MARCRKYLSCWLNVVFALVVLTNCQNNEQEEHIVNDKTYAEEIEDNGQNLFENHVRLFGEKNCDHIDKTLFLSDDEANDEALTQNILMKLSAIYKYAVKPLEFAYKFVDLNKHVVSDGEIFALPRVVFVGPWSTGKSSIINYILGVENTTSSLPSGAQPTTSDFTVLTYGSEYKTTEGMVLSMDNSYSFLERFGQNFLERLLGIQIPSVLLKKVNFIDTPGVIENRKQRERGYPFVDVCKWFIEHSDLIVFVFDPTKLDVGVELEALFGLLKGHETKVRIILNKADTITPQELLRVYGALFWSLAPLINVTEPPQVYVGSFWSKVFNLLSQVNVPLFLHEEILFLKDLREVIANRLENKIAFVRQHAIRVRNHALLVDQYLKTLQKHKSIFQDTAEIAIDIANNSDQYKVFQSLLINSDINREDLHSPKDYAEFFELHAMNSFLPLSKHCGFISSCLLDTINYAIQYELPALLDEVQTLQGKTCQKDLCNSQMNKVPHQNRNN
ncbi:sarcalumenin-like isoform X2 [Centruroides vittatus]|uniref:sarcalumenin-like isoform X2 n=1 Tax=Centruroides vittatus TaxID=120091 RepID=UPI00350FFB12